MAKIIDFQAAINSRRAAAEKAATSQRIEKKIDECVSNMLDSAANGDHIGAIKNITEANRLQKQINEPTPAYCDPANKFEGSKYNRNLSTTEIAALIRSDIKLAQKRGTLPKIKISVTRDYFSGGSSIDVNIKSLPEGQQLYTAEYLDATQNLTQPPPYDYFPRPKMYTDNVQNWLDQLQAIVDAYKMDNSDSMTDYFHVNFYDHVGIYYGLK